MKVMFLFVYKIAFQAFMYFKIENIFDEIKLGHLEVQLDSVTKIHLKK